MATTTTDISTGTAADTTAAADDPIRAEVERRLTELAALVVARPTDHAGQLARVLTLPCRTLRRLGEPLALVRSIVELGLGRARGRADVRPSAPVPSASPTATTAVRVPASGGGDELPIDEYESLAASQVVARLDGLTDAELRRVRVFEGAHRSRRTVIGKVDQLLASR